MKRCANTKDCELRKRRVICNPILFLCVQTCPHAQMVYSYMHLIVYIIIGKACMCASVSPEEIGHVLIL